MPGPTFYELTLFVAGASDFSARAIAQTRALCDGYLAGRHHLSVVDVTDDPAAVTAGRVFAAPTLMRNRPAPERRVVGDLSQAERVLLALGIPDSEGLPRPTG